MTNRLMLFDTFYLIKERFLNVKKWPKHFLFGFKASAATVNFIRRRNVESKNEDEVIIFIYWYCTNLKYEGRKRKMYHVFVYI